MALRVKVLNVKRIDVQVLGVDDTLTATHAGVVRCPVGIDGVDQGNEQPVLEPQCWLVKEQVRYKWEVDCPVVETPGVDLELDTWVLIYIFNELFK